MAVQAVPRSMIKRNSTTTLKRVVPDVKHKICSIYPKEFVFSIHRNPILPACDDNSPKESTGFVDGIRYTFVEVGPGRSVKDESVDTGTQFLERYLVTEDIHSKTVALDCLGYSINEEGVASETESSRTFRGRGVFVPEGDEPTKEELLRAKVDWNNRAIAEYDRAQMDWAQYRKSNNISDHARIAAHLLGKNPEWLGGLESGTGPRPKTETETLLEAIKLLLSNQAQGLVPPGSGAAPVTKGK